MKIGETALRIIELYDAGQTTAQIAEELGTKPACIRSRKSRIEHTIGRRLTELTYRADLNENGLTRKQQLFVDLHRQGLTASGIAARMGITKSTVYSWRDYIHRVKGVSFEKAKRESRAIVKLTPVVVKSSLSETERHVAALLGDLFDPSYYRDLNICRRSVEAS